VIVRVTRSAIERIDDDNGSRRRAGRVGPLGGLVALLLAGVVVASAVLMFISSRDATGRQSLVIYSAVSVRPSLAEISARYGEQTGTRFEIQYGGSNTLLSQLQVHNAAPADLFLSADSFYTLQAVDEGLATEVWPVAVNRPVIAVAPGNPKGIQSLQDLLRDDVRVGVADPEQAAIGRVVREGLLQIPHESGTLWDALAARVTAAGVFKPTVNDVANDVALGAIDAALVWDSTARTPEYRDQLDAVETPELALLQSQFEIALLKSSPNPDAASAFARYCTTDPDCFAILHKNGLQPAEVTSAESPPADAGATAP
jgi:molybdate transport system substrate-binding protein